MNNTDLKKGDVIVINWGDKKMLAIFEKFDTNTYIFSKQDVLFVYKLFHEGSFISLRNSDVETSLNSVFALIFNTSIIALTKSQYSVLYGRIKIGVDFN